MFTSTSFIMAGVIVLLTLYLSFRTDLLRTPTEINDKSLQKKYSFSRVQLVWWTMIISACYIIMYGETGHFAMNQTTLILLGISVATTASGSVIDAGQAQIAQETNTARHQDERSAHFIKDILSDGHGISTHRFQALIFNLIFGLIFINYFFTHQYQFPDFNSYQMGLLGISSGAYLAVKTNENKSPANKIQQQVGTTHN